MSLSTNVNEKAALIRAIADKLTGVYKPHEFRVPQGYSGRRQVNGGMYIENHRRNNG